ncbi:hypothetical protein LCM4573_08575 [Rhizobium sp. LCM 4573]|nr:hypothetical protein LCM4573_08575 [Rhizobium sp. LCM 4573]
MFSRRKFLSSLGLLSSALICAASPYRLSADPASFLREEKALAKNGNGGSGSEGGGGGEGRGESKGEGRGESKGNGEGKGGREKDSDREGDRRSRRSGEQSRERETKTNAKTGDAKKAEDSQIEVKHRSGIAEETRGGRYIMRDRRGRTIINRTATTADKDRLRSLQKR